MLKVQAESIKPGASVRNVDPSGRGGNSTNRMQTSSSSPATSSPAGNAGPSVQRPGGYLN